MLYLTDQIEPVQDKKTSMFMSCTYNTEIDKYITIVCTKIWATHFLTIFF